MFTFLKCSVNKNFHQLSGRLLNILGRFLIGVVVFTKRALPCYTAVARVGFKRRATAAMLNSTHKLQIHQNPFSRFTKPLFTVKFGFPQKLFHSTEVNSTSEARSCYSRAEVDPA